MSSFIDWQVDRTLNGNCTSAYSRPVITRDGHIDWRRPPLNLDAQATKWFHCNETAFKAHFTSARTDLN